MIKDIYKPELVGVINLTPDSFSDAGEFLQPQSALEQADKLNKDGAAFLDIGADSTRPGSICSGVEEELARLFPFLDKLQAHHKYFIDTHHAQVARRCVEAGAYGVNDVSAGFDAEMFALIAETGVKYVLMYSRCRKPHEFGPEPKGDIVQVILDFFSKKIESALACGIKAEQLILDPGMGAFLSSDASSSYELISRFSELSELNLALMLGISRKGFVAPELQAKERDRPSAELAMQVIKTFSGKVPLYIRVHNVAMHRELLSL